MKLQEVELVPTKGIAFMNAKGWEIFGTPEIESFRPLEMYIPMKREIEVIPENNDEIIKYLKNFVHSFCTNQVLDDLIKDLKKDKHIEDITYSNWNDIKIIWKENNTNQN